jgi:hypothetical protein
MMRCARRRGSRLGPPEEAATAVVAKDTRGWERGLHAETVRERLVIIRINKKPGIWPGFFVPIEQHQSMAEHAAHHAADQTTHERAGVAAAAGATAASAAAVVADMSGAAVGRGVV